MVNNVYQEYCWDLLALQELGYTQLQAAPGSASDPARFQQVSVVHMLPVLRVLSVASV